MEREELVKRLKGNKAACWMGWEVKNIIRTFEGELDDFTVKTESSSQKHTLYDTIENMTASLLKILGYVSEQELLDIWDIFEELEFTLIKEGKEYEFIIS